MTRIIPTILLTALAGIAAAQGMPNAVFILADNVGLGSCGGGELRGAPTPHLDQFAREYRAPGVPQFECRL